MKSLFVGIVMRILIMSKYISDTKRMLSNKAHYDPNEAFSWHEVGRGLKDWKVCLEVGFALI